MCIGYPCGRGDSRLRERVTSFPGKPQEGGKRHGPQGSGHAGAPYRDSCPWFPPQWPPEPGRRSCTAVPMPARVQLYFVDVGQAVADGFPDIRRADVLAAAAATSSGTYRSLRGENHASKALDARLYGKGTQQGVRCAALNSSARCLPARSATARPASSPAIPATAAPRGCSPRRRTAFPRRPAAAVAGHGPALLAHPNGGARSSAFAMCVRGMTAVVQRGRGFRRVRRPLEKEGNALKAIRTCASMPLTSRYTGVPLFRVVEHGQAPEQQGQAEQPRREGAARPWRHVAGRRLISTAAGAPCGSDGSPQGRAGRPLPTEHYRRFRKQARRLERMSPASVHDQEASAPEDRALHRTHGDDEVSWPAGSGLPHGRPECDLFQEQTVVSGRYSAPERLETPDELRAVAVISGLGKRSSAPEP